MKPSTCLLCGYSPLLRQSRHNHVFFYCPSCRQEMTFSASEDHYLHRRVFAEAATKTRTMAS